MFLFSGLYIYCFFYRENIYLTFHNFDSFLFESEKDIFRFQIMFLKEASPYPTLGNLSSSYFLLLFLSPFPSLQYLSSNIIFDFICLCLTLPSLLLPSSTECRYLAALFLCIVSGFRIHPES